MTLVGIKKLAAALALAILGSGCVCVINRTTQVDVDARDDFQIQPRVGSIQIPVSVRLTPMAP